MSINELLPGFLEHLSQERELAKETVRAYRYDLNQFASITGNKALADVSLNDIRQYMGSLKAQGAKAPTVRRKLHALSTFYEYGIITGVCGVNLALQAQRIAPKRKRTVQQRLLSFGHWKAFANTPGESQRDTLAFGLLAWLGVRNGELRSIRVGQVDLDRDKITIQGKGQHERVLDIPEHLRPLVVAQIDGKSSGDYLLEGNNGGEWTRQQFNPAFKRHCKTCGLPSSVTPHWLRHTVLSYIMSEFGIVAAKELGGHSELRSLEPYLHAVGKAAFIVKHPLAS